jgi:hypothetical protein
MQYFKRAIPGMLPKVEEMLRDVEKVEDSIWKGTKPSSSKVSKLFLNSEFLQTDFVYILTVLNDY